MTFMTPDTKERTMPTPTVLRITGPRPNCVAPECTEEATHRVGAFDVCPDHAEAAIEAQS